MAAKDTVATLVSLRDQFDAAVAARTAADTNARTLADQIKVANADVNKLVDGRRPLRAFALPDGRVAIVTYGEAEPTVQIVSPE